MNIDEMKQFLIDNDIKIINRNTSDELFSRIIEFKVYDVKYTISWYANQSTLYIGEGDRRPFVLFRYLFLDTTYPLIDSNKSIAFSQIKNKRVDFLDREYPFESFRIPLEI